MPEAPTQPQAEQTAPASPEAAPKVPTSVTTQSYTTIQEFLKKAVEKNSVPSQTSPAPVEEAPAVPDAPVAEQAPPAPPAKSQLVQELESMGFQNVSDADATQRLLEWAKSQITKPAAPVAPAAPTVQETRPAPPQPTQPQVPFHLNELNLSEEDELLVEQFRETYKDEATGTEKVRWAKEAPIELRRKVEQVAKNRAEYQEALLTRPLEVFDAIQKFMVQPMVQKQVQDTLQAHQHQQQEMNLFRSTVDSNRWMVQVDARTNQPVLDPNDGLPVFSEAGNRVLEHLEMLERYPLAKRWDLAIQLTKSELNLNVPPQAPPAAPAAPAQPTLADLEAKRKENQQNLLRSQLTSLPQAGQAAYQAGTVPTQNGMPYQTQAGFQTTAPARSQNPNVGLGEKFMASMGYQPTR